MNKFRIFSLQISQLTLVSLLFTSCIYSNGGLGPEVKEERNVGEFEGIRISSGIDVILKQGRQTRLTIIADEDLIEDIQSEVINGVLELSIDGRWFRRGHAEALITFVDINLLELSAGSDVKTENFLKLDRIDIKASSGSDLNMTLEANDMSLHVSSGSDADLEGYAGRLYAKATSGSDIDASGLETKDAVLKLSSGSDVNIHVTESLEVEASSGSDVNYRGEPEIIDINTSSGSDVNKR